MRGTAEGQEQLGTAIVHMTQAGMGLEGAWAANQYQLGSLMAAVDRTPPMDGGAPCLASAGARRPEGRTSSGIPLVPAIQGGHLFAGAMVLCGVFFGGLVL